MSTKTKTIRKNSNRFSAAFAAGDAFTVYTLSTNFVGKLVEQEWARANYEAQARRYSAKLIEIAPGRFRVSFHSNRWVEFTAAV